MDDRELATDVIDDGLVDDLDGLVPTLGLKMEMLRIPTTTITATTMIATGRPTAPLDHNTPRMSSGSKYV